MKCKPINLDIYITKNYAHRFIGIATGLVFRNAINDTIDDGIIGATIDDDIYGAISEKVNEV